MPYDLPGRFLNARNLAAAGHFSEFLSRQAEVAHKAARTAGYRAAVLDADGRRVFRQFLECIPVARLLQSGALSRQTGAHFDALQVSCKL